MSGQRTIITTADGDEIVVTLLSVKAGRARIGFEAPRDCVISREELRVAEGEPSDVKGR
jgi:sRNA-binding carbon storage regulator CsrA